MAVMSERRGIPAWVSAASAILLQVVSLGTGAVVVAVFGAGISRTASFAAGVVALAAVGLALWRPLLVRVIARVAPGADLTHIPRAPVIAFGAAANLAAWIGYGVAFWLFARGVLPQSAPGLAESVGAFTASYVAGLIAPFAPGGLGVREGVLVMALRDHTGLGPGRARAAVGRRDHSVPSSSQGESSCVSSSPLVPPCWPHWCSSSRGSRFSGRSSRDSSSPVPNPTSS
jgi:hypothetical protein